MAEIKIEVRAIDLERLGISLCFINTDSVARKDVALQNAKRLADAFASPPVAVQEEGDAARLAFLCDPKERRFVEQERGMWRVYRDIAPEAAMACDWRSMTAAFYPSAIEAIDAAIQGDQP